MPFRNRADLRPDRDGALLLPFAAPNLGGGFHPRQSLLSPGLRYVVRHGETRRHVFPAAVARFARREGNSRPGIADRLRDGFRQPRAHLSAPHRARCAHRTSACVVLRKRRHLGHEPRARSRLHAAAPHHRIRMHVLPQRLSADPRRTRRARQRAGLFRRAARRHRLPALPRARRKPRPRRPDRGIERRGHPQGDREPRPPERRTPDGGVHAMPSGNHQPAAAALHRALQPGPVFLPAGRAAGQFHHLLRSRPGQ